MLCTSKCVRSYAYKYMGKSSTDILWLTSELGNTHKIKSGFGTDETSFMLEFRDVNGVFAVFVKMNICNVESCTMSI